MCAGCIHSTIKRVIIGIRKEILHSDYACNSCLAGVVLGSEGVDVRCELVGEPSLDLIRNRATIEVEKMSTFRSGAL